LPESIREAAFSKVSKKNIDGIETHPKEKHQTLTLGRARCQSNRVAQAKEKEERTLFYGNTVEIHSCKMSVTVKKWYFFRFVWSKNGR
jgi:hypothetical protein